MTTEDLQVTGAPAGARPAAPRVAPPAARAAVTDRRPPAVIDRSMLPYVLSALAAVAATVAAAGSFLFPSLLTGTPVATGNMRGTALAVLLVGLPVLVTAMAHSARGSARPSSYGSELWPTCSTKPSCSASPFPSTISSSPTSDTWACACGAW